MKRLRKPLPKHYSPSPLRMRIGGFSMAAISFLARIEELIWLNVLARRCRCEWTYHRDGVGSINIRAKYLGQFSVVGAMAPPTGLWFSPHTRVARGPRREGALLQ
jgi:hypothetical protein